MLKDLCDEPLNIYLFPNPVSPNQSWLTVSNKSGLFPAGMYTIALFDFTGKLIRKSSQNLANVFQFQYKVSSLPAGNYLLNIEAPLNSKAPFVLRFQKL